MEGAEKLPIHFFVTSYKALLILKLKVKRKKKTTLGFGKWSGGVYGVKGLWLNSWSMFYNVPRISFVFSYGEIRIRRPFSLKK